MIYHGEIKGQRHRPLSVTGRTYARQTLLSARRRPTPWATWRAAQRAGGRVVVTTADPSIDARVVERVRAAAQLHDRLEIPRFQPRQANRANGRRALGVAFCGQFAVRRLRKRNPPPPVPRCRERRPRPGLPQPRLKEVFQSGIAGMLSAPTPKLSGQMHLTLPRRDAEAVQEHLGDEAEAAEEVEQKQEVSPQRELVAVIEARVAHRRHAWPCSRR